MNFTDDALELLNRRNEADSENSDAGNSSDGEQSSSEGDDDGMIEEDEETYVKFVRSVFCDDYSGCSNTDEDDDEEYEPDQKDDDMDDEEDDDDKDLIRVQNRELRELVDGCWQTIVGEAPNIAAVPVREESMDGMRTSGDGPLPAPTSPQGKSGSGMFENMEDDLDFSLLSPLPGMVRSTTVPAPAENGSASAPTGVVATAIAGDANGKAKAPGAAGPSVISSMVMKLFSEGDTSEAHVEGMPVNACRKLVARQLSMATQLLVQILLQADERSECFTKGYTSLMELSNLREAALKKATLVQMNFQNATTIRNHVLDREQQKLRESQASSAGSANDAIEDSSESENELGMRTMRDIRGGPRLANVQFGDRRKGAYVNAGIGALSDDGRETSSNSSSSASDGSRRLTRSATLRDATVNSVFNVPILGKVGTLFDMIDLSRRNIRNRLNSSTLSRSPLLKSVGETSAELRVRTLHAIKEQIYTIMPQLNSRAWRCLLPNALYPLPSAVIRTLDPTTLTGRCMFSPTEDDLLLRGIMNASEGRWEHIKNQYLPSKEAQLLQFRYTQMTSISAVEDNNFKRYQKLSNDYRDRDHTKWSHEEELQLLRGFQAFGERWPLVRVFHLPHRRVTHLRAKWAALQKAWQKVLQTHGGKINATQLPPGVRAFLLELNKDAVEAVRAKAAAEIIREAEEMDQDTSESESENQPPLPPISQATAKPAVPSWPGVPAAATGVTAAGPFAAAFPGIPMGFPGAAQGVPGAATQQAPFPFPMMLPPFLPLNGKMPSTPAEMVAYQQSFQQYQQFMMHQYHSFMMHHMQQQQQQQQQQQNVGAAAAVPTWPQPVPASTASTAAHTKAPFGDLNLSGPPLLRDLGTEKAKKAPREGRQATGSASHASPDGGKGVKPLPLPLPTPGQPAPPSQPQNVPSVAAAALPAEESRGFSFLHDQDSIFSLLMPGNSVAYKDPSVSIPMLDSESAASNSVSQEVSLLSLVRAGNAAAPLTAHRSISTLSEGLKAATAGGLSGTQQPLNTSASAASNALTNKPKKKIIKPMLIAASSMESKRASPAFTTAQSAVSAAASNPKSNGSSSSTSSYIFQPLSQASMTESTADTASQEQTGKSAAAPAKKPKLPKSQRSPKQKSSAPALSTETRPEEQSFSNMFWPDMNRSSGGTGGESLHSPLLEDISLLDASKFAFSNFPMAGSLSGPVKKTSGTKRAHAQSTNGGVEGGGKKAKNGAATAFAKGKGGAQPSGTETAAGAQAFAFEETSNMSLLGDAFNDGDFGVAGFSNMTNLLGLGSPMKSRGGMSVSFGGARSRGGAASADGTNANSKHKRPRESGAVAHVRNEGEGSTGGGGQSGSGGAKKQKQQLGIFAEVMAKAKQGHN